MNNCQFTGQTLPDRASVLNRPFSGQPKASHIPIRNFLMLAEGVGFALLLAGLAQAQEAEFTLNVNVDLVELNVTVLNEGDRHETGLEAGHFEIFEDSVQQDIALFLHEGRPVSLGLVIDNSRSMERKKERVDMSTGSFVRLSNPQDEVFLVTLTTPSAWLTISHPTSAFSKKLWNGSVHPARPLCLTRS